MPFYAADDLLRAIQENRFDGYVFDWVLPDNRTAIPLLAAVRGLPEHRAAVLLSGKTRNGTADPREVGEATVRFKVQMIEKPAQQPMLVSALLSDGLNAGRLAGIFAPRPKASHREIQREQVPRRDRPINLSAYHGLATQNVNECEARSHSVKELWARKSSMDEMETLDCEGWQFLCSAEQLPSGQFQATVRHKVSPGDQIRTAILDSEEGSGTQGEHWERAKELAKEWANQRSGAGRGGA